MCNLSQIHVDTGLKRGLAEGRKEGLTEGLAILSKVIDNIMKKTNQTADEVMEMLDIDESHRPEITQLINAQVTKTEI